MDSRGGAGPVDYNSNMCSSSAKLRRWLLRSTSTCEICGQPLDPSAPAHTPDATEIHERTPVSAGGDPLSRANTVAIHRRCNVSEWVRWRTQRAPVSFVTSRRWGDPPRRRSGAGARVADATDMIAWHIFAKADKAGEPVTLGLVELIKAHDGSALKYDIQLVSNMRCRGRDHP